MSLAERLAAIEAERGPVEWAEVFVTDLNGIQRGKLIPAAMLGKAEAGRLRMPVSAVGLDVFGQDVPESGIAIERGDPDGPLIPVPETLAPVLWAARPTVQLLCAMGEGEGPCAYDPRAVLARVAERAAARGLTAAMAFELEFYLVDPARPAPPAAPAGPDMPPERDQIYELSVLAAHEPVISRIAEAARALGAPAETVICEFGAGQFEINLGHVADPLAAADHAVMLKRAIRGVARAEGLDATFMAKPYGSRSGSGMHVHASLAGAGGRALFDAGGADGPNEAARHALAGLIATMPEAMLVWAPHLNSYRRFVPGSYAPLVAAWGLDNRGTALRMPELSGPGARIEHRVAGADANPYLVGAAMLAGMLAGLEAGAEPPPPVEAEAGDGQGAALPGDWAEAERRLRASAFAADRLGREFVRVFSAMKRQERATMLARVSDVEYEAYLRTV